MSLLFEQIAVQILKAHSYSMRSKIYVLPVKSRRKSATINVNTAEPIIAQTTGNGLPSILIVKNSGKAKRPAIYKPI